jgi:hypothetical protein
MRTAESTLKEKKTDAEEVKTSGLDFSTSVFTHQAVKLHEGLKTHLCPEFHNYGPDTTCRR